jgi:dTDP-4-dehydrorhamnose 3,5-epimerase-like enzyme
MKNLNIKSTSLEGLKLLTRSPISDERGFFARLFCSDELKLANWTKPISQINLSYTKKKGTVRTILSFTDTDERFYAAGEVVMSYLCMRALRYLCMRLY